jgi:hypothetical protein
MEPAARFTAFLAGWRASRDPIQPRGTASKAIVVRVAFS